jgi:hypothetical protein
MACWFLSQPEYAAFKRNLVAKADSRRGFHYGLNLLGSNSLEFYMKTKSGFAGASSDAETVPSTGEWTFVAGVFDSDRKEIRLYRDGEEIHRQGDVAELPAQNDSGPLRIGFAAGSSGSDAFIGLMDDVGVWGRALSSEEIRSLFNQGMSEDLADGCAGYWDFEAMDSTGQFPSLYGSAGPMGLFDGAKAFAEGARRLQGGEASN